MLDDDCALCLTPQGFNNVDAQSDIFNNLNLSFWEYMLPGTDALGYIACTGTNFCLRCAPLADCGFFPTWTITEDYALGMILKAKVGGAEVADESALQLPLVPHLWR
jgi:endoglucanase